MEVSPEPSQAGDGGALRGSSLLPQISPALEDVWAAGEESLRRWEGGVSPPGLHFAAGREMCFQSTSYKRGARKQDAN